MSHWLWNDIQFLIFPHRYSERQAKTCTGFKGLAVYLWVELVNLKAAIERLIIQNQGSKPTTAQDEYFIKTYQRVVD